MNGQYNNMQLFRPTQLLLALAATEAHFYPMFVEYHFFILMIRDFLCTHIILKKDPPLPPRTQQC